MLLAFEGAYIAGQEDIIGSAVCTTIAEPISGEEIAQLFDLHLTDAVETANINILNNGTL